MPFMGLNPQSVRLTPSPGGSNTTNATTQGTSQLNNIVDTATCQNLPGMVAWFKDSQGQVSVLAYAIAQASITYGAALMHQAGGATTSTGVASTIVRGGNDCNVVAAATTGLGGLTAGFAGVAAASVINTGAYFWRYISGYVPEAQVGSAIASGHLLIVSASAGGFLASMASIGTQTGSMMIPVGVTLGTNGNSAGSIASVLLTGWYM